MHNMYDEISQYHFIDLALQCIPLCMHIYIYMVGVCLVYAVVAVQSDC